MVFSLPLQIVYAIAFRRFIHWICSLDLHVKFQNSCFRHLLKDFKRKGICEGFSNPLNYSTSQCNSKEKTVNLDIDTSGLPRFKTIVDGVCSKRTERLLLKRGCVFILYQQSNLIYKNILFLLLSMCRSRIFNRMNIFPSKIPRLVAFNNVMELNDATVSTNLEFGMVYI